jgi:hypothetical protein
MPDGTRRRRFSKNPARRSWYARSRALRFARRFAGYNQVAQDPRRQSV